MASQKNTNDALRLLRALYAETPEAHVELRAIPNDRNAQLPIKRLFATTPSQVTTFIADYGQKGSGRSVYFGVNKRDTMDGSKKSISRVSALYADVDTEKNGWDTDEIIKRIHGMKGLLRPTACVRSGGGLHLYWFVNTWSLDQLGPGARNGEVQTVEAIGTHLRDIFAGDAVQNIDRILRLPGTYNERRKSKVSLAWCYEFERHDANDIATAAVRYKSCLGDDGTWMDRASVEKAYAKRKPVDPMDQFEQVYTGGTRSALKGVDLMWRERVRYHAPRGYIGIHEAALVHTAQLYIGNPDYPEDTVVRLVMERIKEVKDRDAPHEDWDMGKEAKSVLKMYRTFQPKWKEFSRELRRQQAAERKKQNGSADHLRQRGR